MERRFATELGEPLTALLNALGVSVLLATAAEAIAALGQASHDRILMDCRMPGLDGLEATRRIRGGAAGSPSANVPLMALTAHALAEERNRCLAASMSGYLNRPLQPQASAEALERWLPPRSGVGAESEGEAEGAPSAGPPWMWIVAGELPRRSDVPTAPDWARTTTTRNDGGQVLAYDRSHGQTAPA